jgi:hypothetical protein
MFGRKYFTSGDEIRGVGPPSSRIGDAIIILKGCDYAAILRKDDDSWMLLGDAYVGCFMEGEIVKL